MFCVFSELSALSMVLVVCVKVSKGPQLVRFETRLCLEALAVLAVLGLGLAASSSISSSTSSGRGGGRGSSASISASTGTGHLEGDVATEGAGAVVVGDLEQAEVGGTAGGVGASALGAGGDLDTEGLQGRSGLSQSGSNI